MSDTDLDKKPEAEGDVARTAVESPSAAVDAAGAAADAQGTTSETSAPADEAQAPPASASNPDASASGSAAGGEASATTSLAASTTADGAATEEGAATAEPPPGIQVRLYGQTDVGLVREHNEDNFVVVDLSTKVRGLDERLTRHEIGPRGSIFAVCDGMGGAAAGEVASQMAVDTLHDLMLAGDVPESRDHFARRLVYAIEEAGSRIFSAAKMDRSRRGMGTTSTVAGIVDKILFVGQIGDSRAYALRGGKDFALITKDQSLVNQLIEAGQLTEEEAEAFEHSNIILQALGTAEQVTVDLTFLELKRGDRLMLCSDGLSGLVHGEMIKDVLATVSDPRACCATLIEMARAGGGHDNITVIVIDFDGADLALPTDGSRVAYQQYPLPEIADAKASLPPREPGMKAGAQKPGSDVKHSLRPAGARSEDDATAPLASGRPWTLAIVVLVVLLVVAIGYVVLRGGDASAETSDAADTEGSAVPPAASAGPVPPPEPEAAPAPVPEAVPMPEPAPAPVPEVAPTLGPTPEAAQAAPQPAPAAAGSAAVPLGRVTPTRAPGEAPTAAAAPRAPTSETPSAAPPALMAPEEGPTAEAPAPPPAVEPPAAP
jgi:serine/threonine protein phosphatase PrpC